MSLKVQARQDGAAKFNTSTAAAAAAADPLGPPGSAGRVKSVAFNRYLTQNHEQKLPHPSAHTMEMLNMHSGFTQLSVLVRTFMTLRRGAPARRGDRTNTEAAICTGSRVFTGDQTYHNTAAS